VCDAGPLMACVNAQAQAALTTLNFVKSVGFDDSGEAIYVQFVFNRTNGTTGDVEENKIDVPMLTILPIPYLRVSVRLLSVHCQLLFHPLSMVCVCMCLDRSKRRRSSSTRRFPAPPRRRRSPALRTGGTATGTTGGGGAPNPPHPSLARTRRLDPTQRSASSR
jgi:Protein of unknown function (DUF2589)